MIKIAEIKRARMNRINFKEWVKKFYKQGITKNLKVIRIFLPSQYDNYTLILYDEENNLEVSRTLSKDIGKQCLKKFGFSVRGITQGVLWLLINEQGEIYLTLKDNSNLGYVFEKNSFVLKDLSQYQVDDDIPF
jgi:uncharacterized protein (UPF0254 family)